MALMKQQARAKNTQYVDDIHAIGVIKKSLTSLDFGIEVMRQHNENQFSVFESLKSQTAREVR